MRIKVLALCTASAVAIPPALAQDPTGSTAAQIEHGRARFIAGGCSACHGTVGQGSRVTGPRLAPNTMPLAAFLQVLRHPTGDMPPYVVQVLPDTDARDIHAYLESLSGPSQRIQDVPALNH